MSETLEDRVKQEEFSIWEFLVAAYSSSRAVKIGLETAAAGYSFPVVGLFSMGFYLTAKTVGSGIKYITDLLRKPERQFNLSDMFYEAKSSYNPLGKHRRPNFMGTILSVVGYKGF
ncbi:hypothetical protein HQ529_02890 [Candidatus Woesearchaeota archaeon]|nr:hypothetical protein [Candidatus Woesearchaeota archaeon]